jgi:glycosyltransferase involved in cell wall biosynthesis
MTDPMNNKDKARVAIVLPTHNRGHLVSRAINSVLAQTFQDWTLYVVDDGSSDNTGEVIAAFKEPRISYVRNARPSGPSGARNSGILACRDEEYLAFLDDDDEWLPRKLELQVAMLDQDPRLVAVGCGRIDYSSGGPEVHLPRFRGGVFEDLLARRARGYGAQLIMVRRRSGAADLLFDASMRCLEDADYSMRLAKLGPFDFVNEPLAKIYRDDGGEHAWNSAAAIEGYLQLGQKYRAELSSRPWVRAYYDVCMARDFARLGKASECREALQRAAAGSEQQLRLSMWRLAAVVGGPFFRAMARLVPIDPPSPRKAVAG